MTNMAIVINSRSANKNSNNIIARCYRNVTFGFSVKN